MRNRTAVAPLHAVRSSLLVILRSPERFTREAQGLGFSLRVLRSLAFDRFLWHRVRFDFGCRFGPKCAFFRPRIRESGKLRTRWRMTQSDANQSPKLNS